MKIEKEIIEKIKAGEVGIMPTDTIYGIVASAFSPIAIERIYKLKRRTTSAALIIIISSLADLKKLDLNIAAAQKKILGKIWPGPVSVILPCGSKKLTYLHRGNYSLAVRMPKEKWLIDFIKKVGPIVATSANLHGADHVENTAEAKKLFGKKVDFYLDNGNLSGKASTIISLSTEGLKILRQGAGKLPNDLQYREIPTQKTAKHF